MLLSCWGVGSRVVIVRAPPRQSPLGDSPFRPLDRPWARAPFELRTGPASESATVESVRLAGGGWGGSKDRATFPSPSFWAIGCKLSPACAGPTPESVTRCPAPEEGEEEDGDAVDRHLLWVFAVPLGHLQPLRLPPHFSHVRSLSKGQGSELPSGDLLQLKHFWRCVPGVPCSPCSSPACPLYSSPACPCLCL